jgi:Rho termination factor-like protein
MAKKTLRSAAGAAEDQLKAGARKIRGQLAPVEKAAEKVATKAKEHLPSAAGLMPELPAVRDRLERAKATVSRRRGRAAGSAGAGSTPDDSWTVAELREEARSRGLTGYSRKKKAELLAALRR